MRALCLEEFHSDICRETFAFAIEDLRQMHGRDGEHRVAIIEVDFPTDGVNE